MNTMEIKLACIFNILIKLSTRVGYDEIVNSVYFKFKGQGHRRILSYTLMYKKS